MFQFLKEHKIPHMIFINKMDTASQTVQSVLEGLQENCDLPLVLRQVPIADGEKNLGYVDLVSEDD